MAELPYVLVVEDDPQRRAWFANHLRTRHTSFTDDPQEAIFWLYTDWTRCPDHCQAYDRLYLDHDLFPEFDQSQPAKAGRDVATWLIQHPDLYLNLDIVCHSVNEVSGAKILRELTTAGRRATWMPFPSLTRAHIDG